jgi:membrane-associated phospholipid phosphatase
MYYVDLFGFYGPYVLGAINTFYLWNHRYYFTACFVGGAVSDLINRALKHLIREPRPDHQVYLVGHDDPTHFDRFGMPSGHAQMTGYAITVLYLVTANPAALILSAFIGSLTLFQRYTYRRHTPKQLIVGLIVGCIIANITYEFTRNYLLRR